MKKNYIKVDGKIYAFDIDAVMKWCLTSKDNPVNEYEITEGYDMEDVNNVGSKVIRELRSPNTQDDTIRYDFIKLIVTPLISGMSFPEEMVEDPSFALVFNTCLEKGFIKEINEE